MHCRRRVASLPGSTSTGASLEQSMFSSESRRFADVLHNFERQCTKKVLYCTCVTVHARKTRPKLKRDPINAFGSHPHHESKKTNQRETITNTYVEKGTKIPNNQTEEQLNKNPPTQNDTQQTKSTDRSRTDRQTDRQQTVNV